MDDLPLAGILAGDPQALLSPAARRRIAKARGESDTLRWKAFADAQFECREGQSTAREGKPEGVLPASDLSVDVLQKAEQGSATDSDDQRNLQIRGQNRPKPDARRPQKKLTAKSRGN